MTKHTLCTVDGCSGKHRALGLCYGHYSRMYKTGSLGSRAVSVMFRSLDFDDGTRSCNSCGERLPLDAFYKAKNCKLGHRSTCKSCSRARDAARRLVVPETYLALDRLGNIRRRARLLAVGFDAAVTHAALRHRDGDMCHYCGTLMSFEPMRRGEARRDKASIEHLVPLARGGSHTFTNTVLACLGCNFSKNDKTPDEWFATSA